MAFVLITCGIIIIVLLAVILSLRSDRKFMTEMYHDLKSEYEEALDKWKETIDKWGITLKTCDEILGSNSKLVNHIDELEKRISSLEKMHTLYLNTEDCDLSIIGEEEE